MLRSKLSAGSKEIADFQLPIADSKKGDGAVGAIGNWKSAMDGIEND
jgi:hypothetical protein